MEQDREEGEMSDDVEMENESCDIEYNMKESHDTSCTIFYKADKNGLIMKKLDKIDASKLDERAKRFGINLTGNKIVTQQQIDELYNNFNIASGNERHFRFDALHIRGVKGLSTKDIFEYLQDYKPSSLEWVDENSCNIICQDHISVALSLLLHSREIVSKEIKAMISEKSSYHWREGLPHPRTDMILMRFATKSDKKGTKNSNKGKIRDQNIDERNNDHKNPWGDLCQSWGVYDHQEIFKRKLIKNNYEDQLEYKEPPTKILIKNQKLAKRLGKRNLNMNDDVSSDSDSEWKAKSKVPRMRMHADDEESKIKKLVTTVQVKDEYAPLSIEVINSTSVYRPRETNIVSERFKSVKERDNRKWSTVSANIQSRLGVKIVPEDGYVSEGSSSDNSDHNIMSKVSKVRKNPSSVWSRLDVKANNCVGQSDLRQMLKTKKHKSGNDLRDRLSKAKHTHLRIEIDNS